MTATIKLNILKLITALIFVAASVIIIHPVFAQGATPGATRKANTLQKVETRVASREAKITQKIETRAAMKEKMATREAALKAKLDAFKDKKKAEIADRVNTNLNKVNQNQTALMQKHLDSLATLLNKIEARVNKSTPDIKDPAGAKTAIADARAKITSASAAIKAQSEKDYTVSVTSESKVRADAQVKREELYKDIMALRKQVIDVRGAVANSIKVARGDTVVKEGTSSGQQ